MPYNTEKLGDTSWADGLLFLLSVVFVSCIWLFIVFFSKVGLSPVWVVRQRSKGNGSSNIDQDAKNEKEREWWDQKWVQE